MADKKSTLKDYALRVLRELLNKPEEVPAEARKLRLEDVKMDDLEREKIGLAQEEQRTLLQLRKLETDKKRLFSEAVQNASQREQMVLARRITELDAEANSLDLTLQGISKKMRVLNGLIQVKKRSIALAGEGGVSVLDQLDIADLTRYVSLASRDGQFQMDKFDVLLNAMAMESSLAPEFREDNATLAVFEAIRRTQEAGESVEDGFNRLEAEKKNATPEEPSEEF